MTSASKTRAVSMVVEMRAAWIALDATAPVVRAALDAWREDHTQLGPELAWLVLAIYAHVNNLLDEVTNAHEQTLQSRVIASIGAALPAS